MRILQYYNMYCEVFNNPYYDAYTITINIHV